MPRSVRMEILRRRQAGEKYAVIAAAVGVCTQTIWRVVRDAGGMAPRRQCRNAAHLSVAARDEILIGIERRESNAVIAARVGCHPSTVSREIARNGGRARYRPNAAERRAFEQARRAKASKLVTNRRLHDAVAAMLAQRYSPQQISARLKLEHVDDAGMRVSHETIYQALYVQARGGFRKELTAALRTGRVRRTPHTRPTSGGRGRIQEMINISQRPPQVADRAVPGHWEGDLLIGANNASAIATLVERSTRYVLLAALPQGQSASSVRDAITASILTLPAHLRRSLTWDQGKEMAQHQQFTIDTNVTVYFCDPHSPWQRGSNENTNGLLRQYFPKGTSLKNITQEQLNAVAAQLNARPRQTLGWMKPSEKLAELLALTP